MNATDDTLQGWSFHNAPLAPDAASGRLAPDGSLSISLPSRRCCAWWERELPVAPGGVRFRAEARIALGAGALETRAHLGEAGVEAIADSRTEVSRDVEDNALLTEGSTGGAARVHLRIAMEVGDLADSASEGDALAVKEGRLLALSAKHLAEADACARHVWRFLRDKALQQWRPVCIAAEGILPTVEGVVEKRADSVSHGNYLS